MLQDEFQKRLVVQIAVSPDGASAFDDVVALEGALQSALDPNLAVIDGHDAGSGEMNVFIDTDKPEAVCDVVKSVLARLSLLRQAKVAYRSFDSDDYVVLWPPDALTFEVQ